MVSVLYIVDKRKASKKVVGFAIGEAEPRNDHRPHALPQYSHNLGHLVEYCCILPFHSSQVSPYAPLHDHRPLASSESFRPPSLQHLDLTTCCPPSSPLVPASPLLLIPHPPIHHTANTARHPPRPLHSPHNHNTTTPQRATQSSTAQTRGANSPRASLD